MAHYENMVIASPILRRKGACCFMERNIAAKKVLESFNQMSISYSHLALFTDKVILPLVIANLFC